MTATTNHGTIAATSQGTIAANGHYQTEMTFEGAFAKAPSRCLFAAFATLALVLAFCLSLAAGADMAYANGETDQPSNDNASAASENGPDSSQSNPAASIEGGTGGTALPQTDTATTPDVSALTQTNANNQVDNRSLEAAENTPYPGDDSSMQVFIGLVPVSTESYDVETAYRDETTNAVHVDVSSEVGKGVDLGVAIDYMRVHNNTYDARDGSSMTAGLIDGGLPGQYEYSSPNQGLMYSWYINDTPIGQGTYVTSGAISTQPENTGKPDVREYGVKYEDFLSEKTFLVGDTTWKAALANGGPVRFISAVPYAYRDTRNKVEVGERNDTGGYDSGRHFLSPLFFEEPGSRIIVAQFTYAQRCVITDPQYAQVGYRLYASNPVVFHIEIVPKQTANLNIIAQDAVSGETIDLNSNQYFVDLQKEYLSGYQNLEPGFNYEFLRYAFCDNRNRSDLYAYATPGLYKLTISHVDNLYTEYTEYFEIIEEDMSIAWSSPEGNILKFIDLQPYVPPAQYTITFYGEDGTTVIPVSGTDENGAYVTVNSREYNEGTLAERIWAPPHPTKAATDSAKYVFDRWRAEVVGEGSLDQTASLYDYLYPVTCNTNYIAVFKEIPLKDDAGRTIVYATGGLFSSDAKPTGVLSYGLTSEPLTEAQKSSVVEAHSGVIASDQVLGMVQVDLKQYNDDAAGSVTNVTEHEGLNGMTLKFNMAESGIDAVDGDKLKILQIHKKDQYSPEEIIEHKATVENGEVSLTLNGKLSMFVFLKDVEAQSDPGDSYPGDDGSQDIFFGLVPSNEFTYSIDENGVLHVYLSSNVGKSLDLGANLNYARFGETVYDARTGVANIPISDDLHEQDGAMICWYAGDAPLPAGAYSTNVTMYQSEMAAPYTSDPGYLMDSTEVQQYGVSAFSFLFSFFTNGETGWQYEIPNRILSHAIDTPYTDSQPYSAQNKYAFRLASDDSYVFDAKYHPKYLLFSEPGTLTFTVQASYAVETVTPVLDPGTGEPFVDEQGNTYERVDYAIYMSHPVVFHIEVGEAPAANLVLSAKDASEDEIPLGSDFKIELYKQLEDGSYALCSSESTYAAATTGSYKLKVTSKYGTYEPKEMSFDITNADVEGAGEDNPVITKTIELVAIPNPAQYVVSFVNYDDTVLSTATYNANTLSEVVVVPDNPTRPEDDGFTYEFERWEYDQGGQMAEASIFDVTCDRVYRAHFRAIPKDVVSDSTIRVYASGGLFGRPRPEGVYNHELVVTLPSEGDREDLLNTYAGSIGRKVVDGVYVVDIIQHKTDGTSESLTEGIGDVTLYLPVTFADGTRANVIQLHQPSNGGTLIIEHNNLRVEGGSVAVPLNDKLSTFIVMSAEDQQASDSEGESVNANPGSTPSNTSGGNSAPESTRGASSGSGAAASGGAQTGEVAVKAAPAKADGEGAGSDEASLEGDKSLENVKTGDPLSACALAFAALAALVLAVVARRKTQQR